MALRNQTKRKVKSPQEKSGPGYFLWLILGGPDINFAEAAKPLGLTAASLNSITQGHWKITLQLVEKRGWVDILAGHYPESWEQHRKEFLAAIGQRPIITPPENKESFGYVIWSVLGGLNANFTQSAELLNVSVYNLNNLTRGRWNASRQYIEDRKWAEILATHYPEAWKQYKADFFKYLQAQPSRATSQTLEPQDKDSFGYVLWQIIGGKKAHIGNAANLLNVPKKHLGSVLHGRWIISRKYIENKEWRQILAAHFPEGWKKHKDTFEAKAKTLPAVTFGQTPEPENDKSFGYVVWQILGGEKANISRAAPLFGFTVAQLSKSIHGKWSLHQSYIIQNKWASILAENYPLNWQKYESLYFERLRQLPETGKSPHKHGVLSSPPKDKDSFGYILWLIIGGRYAEPRKTGKLLFASQTTILSVLSGRKPVTQRLIAQRQWCEVLASNFPITWREHQDEFERRVAELPLTGGGFSAEAGRKPPKKLSSEPVDKKSFGHTLWLILGGVSTHITEAADLLGVSNKNLSEILHNKRTPSQSFLDKKDWRRILAEKYPKGWAAHKGAFEKYAQNLSVRNARPIENTLGEILWLILGGEDIKLSEAAGNLGISPAFLRGIIYKNQKVSRAWLKQRQWPELLQQHYPDTWRQNKKSFDAYVETLSASKGRRTDEPKDKESFGHTLWLIFGGKDADLSAASRLVGIGRSYLGDIVHGHETITQDFVADKNLQNLLATHFPEGWNSYKSTFQKRLEDLPVRAKSLALSKPILNKPVTVDWHLAVGEFVERVRHTFNDSVSDLADKSSSAYMKKEENWRRVEAGDEKLSLKFCQRALKEICEIYGLPKHPSSKLYCEAKRLGLGTI